MHGARTRPCTAHGRARRARHSGERHTQTLSSAHTSMHGARTQAHARAHTRADPPPQCARTGREKSSTEKGQPRSGPALMSSVRECARTQGRPRARARRIPTRLAGAPAPPDLLLHVRLSARHYPAPTPVVDAHPNLCRARPGARGALQQVGSRGRLLYNKCEHRLLHTDYYIINVTVRAAVAAHPRSPHPSGVRGRVRPEGPAPK
jgi:hypothetical protein